LAYCESDLLNESIMEDFLERGDTLSTSSMVAILITLYLACTFSVLCDMVFFIFAPMR